jgi:hypothetical protein
VVVLYIDAGTENGHLYSLFASDVRQWHKTSRGDYQLALSRTSFETKLEFYRFDASKVHLIESLIRSAESSGEFRNLVYGRGDLRAGSARVHGTGTVISPKDTTNRALENGCP